MVIDSIDDPGSEWPGDLVPPTDPVELKAWRESILRESRQKLLQTIREHDEALKELEKDRGILERLFGYCTSV